MKLKKILKRMMFDERIELYWAKEKAKIFFNGYAGEIRDLHKEALNLKVLCLTRSREATRIIVKINE